MSNKYEHFMSIALHEAQKGIGYTSPNPMVGSVIVKNNKILATGYHSKIGKAHAEVDAIKKLSKDDLKDSTLYVTLEPCCHYGKTPPCTEMIIKAGIKQVIIACLDTDERVKDRSVNILKNAGIVVIEGIMEKAAHKLNSLYFFNKKNKRPYIVLKAALTLDGKIAASGGDSKWISSSDCRKIVHKLRLLLKSIAIGKKTIINDSPSLNCRLEGFTDKPVDKLIFADEEINSATFAENKGKIHYITRKISSSAQSFIEYCNLNDINSILIEGGGSVYTWFLEKHLVDRIFLFYKCSFLGKDGISVYNGEGIKRIEELTDFTLLNTRHIDNNFMIEMSKGEPICLQV